ncbi:MAG: hypothetical protein ACRCVN_04865 [Spirochaetia bacterium]
MKILLSLFILMVNVVFPVLAQQQEPSIYSRNVRIHDMRFHKKGYVVYYVRENGRLQRVFLPFSWFSFKSRGELIFEANPSNPTMTVFFKDGKPARIRIRVTPGDIIPSYGAPLGEVYRDSDFPNVPLEGSKEFVF